MTTEEQGVKFNGMQKKIKQKWNKIFGRRNSVNPKGALQAGRSLPQND